MSCGITFIEKGSQESFLSYSDLYDAALRALGYFQSKGIGPGDELVFQIEDNKTFVISFWACILGGIIPVPLTTGQNENHKQKLFNIWCLLNNPFICVSANHLSKLQAFAEGDETAEIFKQMAAASIDTAGIFTFVNKGRQFEAKENDIAFIQFSSGSTGNSKGVVLTHRNLISNMEGISKAAIYAEADSMISWMPLTHDMGLIGFHLNPLFCGLDHYLMPTALFVLRPELWLQKASEYKVNILCSPNFGYHYVLKHCDLSNNNWDLSHVRIIYNGAEPVSEELCRRFLYACAKFGLKSHAMCPVYGLAEATLAVSISDLESEVMDIRVDRNKLKPGDKVSLTAAGNDLVSFVNVGSPISGCHVRIADNENNALPEGTIGLVQIKGESVTAGYYNNIEETKRSILPGGWLNTGDLGFIYNHAFYITGRAKDIIFVNGQNYYPHDIERIGEEVEGIELNKVVVAGHFNHKLQKEECVAFVFYRGSLPDFNRIATTFKGHVGNKTGLEIDRVIPVTEIPRTTSGKLQRFKLIELLQGGKYDEVEDRLMLLQQEQVSPVTLPQTNTEERLLRIWNEILNPGNIGVDHNFFATGGNSLNAALMSMMILKEFEVELLPDVIYEKQTIKQIAQKIDSLGKAAYLPLHFTTEKYHSLSPSQKGVYHFCRLNSSSVCYNVPVAFSMDGKPDINRLEACLQLLIQRHDSLRTSFSAAGDQAEINGHADFSLQQARSTKSHLQEIIHSLIIPFDLQKAPLFRATLINVEDGSYVLFLDFHHIIADGLSVWNFMRELVELYQGNTPPALSVQYKDYVSWLNENFASDDMERQKGWWLNRLSGDLPVLELPCDEPRPAVFSFKGSKISFELSKETTARLRAVAARNNCTLHTVMFTLYVIMLSKYSGQEEIICGIAVAGRRHPDLINVAGMFVNNLAIRSHIPGNETFNELLQKQKDHIRDALINQDYPFEELVKALNNKRNVSRNPVFDTMFVYQNMPVADLKLEELSFNRVNVDAGISKFDLSMEVFEECDSLICYIEYCTDLFRTQTIWKFAAHFETLIDRVLAAPDTRLQDISIIPHDEYDAFMINMNATQTAYPATKTLHQLFEEQVCRTPDLIAVEYENNLLTYRALNTKADFIAGILREKGIVPDVVVAVFLERSAGIIESMLAILKAGGCFLPIETGWPAERIKFVLENSQCKLVITNEKVLHKQVIQIPDRIEIVDVDKLNADSQPQPSIENCNTSRDLCYIIYTSGTTGYPKGVMIEHRSAVNYILWANEQYVRGDQMDFPLYTSIAFDLTITSVFTPLLSGNRLVVYNEQPNEFLLERILSEDKVDIIKLTPSHCKLLAGLLEAPGNIQCRLKRMIVGGEQLESVLAKKINDLFQGNIEIYNEYGPTESTVGCMIHTFNAGEEGSFVPIGVPAANTRIYILDKYLKPVPAGVYGEIFIAGDGLARGYLFNEALTNERFLPDPFYPGEKMYKTGDVARRLHDGIMAFCGRYDQQIKLNGYRIELSEIRMQLMEHTDIDEALLIVNSNTKNQYIYAYYTVNPEIDHDIDPLVLRSYLAARLPYYMIPAHFIKLKKIPLTSNGKVDYDALPAPDKELNDHSNPVPVGAMEPLMLTVWKEVLGDPNITVNDNFYELGGDSIKAIQVASLMLGKGIAIEVKDILTYHTIRHISAYATKANDAFRYHQGVVKGERELLPVEKWFFANQFKNPGFYNQSVLLQFKRKINIACLEATFNAIIKHHDGFRLNYDGVSGKMFYNQAHLENRFQLEIRSAEMAGITPNLAQNEVWQTFNIANDLLLRCAVYTNANGNDLLLITAHHLVMDGISWRIILNDLYDIYIGFEQGKEMVPLRKTASSLDWASGLSKYAMDNELSAEEDHWNKTQQVKFAIPHDFETPDWRYINLDKCSLTFSRETTGLLLIQGNRTFRSDIGMIINGALAWAISQWTGDETIRIELENHGRHLENVDVSRTTGWFTVMHPVLIEIKMDSIDGFLRSIKEQISNIPNNGMGYGLYAAVPSPNKITDLRFNYLGQFNGELNNELFNYVRKDLVTESDAGNHMTAKLEVNAMVINGELLLDLLYNTTAHKKTTINYLIELIRTCIQNITGYLEKQKEVQFSPSGFSGVVLDEDELNSLFQ